MSELAPLDQTMIADAIGAERREIVELLEAAKFIPPRSDIALGINGTLTALIDMIRARP